MTLIRCRPALGSSSRAVHSLPREPPDKSIPMSSAENPRAARKAHGSHDKANGSRLTRLVGSPPVRGARRQSELLALSGCGSTMEPAGPRQKVFGGESEQESCNSRCPSQLLHFKAARRQAVSWGSTFSSRICKCYRHQPTLHETPAPIRASQAPRNSHPRLVGGQSLQPIQHRRGGDSEKRWRLRQLVGTVGRAMDERVRDEGPSGEGLEQGRLPSGATAFGAAVKPLRTAGRRPVGADLPLRIPTPLRGLRSASLRSGRDPPRGQTACGAVIRGCWVTSVRSRQE